MNLNAHQSLVSYPAGRGQARPSLAVLFVACFKIGLFSFGGGLSGWLFREFVDKSRWVSSDEFMSSLTISQMLPGANVINLVICLGEQLRGPLGAAVCVFGFVVGPFFAVIGTSILIGSIPDAHMLKFVLGGMAYAAVGLMIVMCARGVRQLRHTPSSLLIVLATICCVSLLGLPILVAVAIFAPISVFLAWHRQAKSDA